MHNLFFGAFPGEEDAARICGETQKLVHGLDGSPVRNDRLHTTLIEYTKVRDSPERIIESSLAAGSAIVMSAFDVSFDRALSFPNNTKGKPLVLAGGEGVAGLLALQRALIKALHKQWLKIPANPRYAPHMTLLYSKKILEEQSIPPLRWRVREFALVYSHAGEGHHEFLGRWPLRDTRSIDSGAPTA
jgi:2'-5' RNA ligase